MAKYNYSGHHVWKDHLSFLKSNFRGVVRRTQVISDSLIPKNPNVLENCTTRYKGSVQQHYQLSLYWKKYIPANSIYPIMGLLCNCLGWTICTYRSSSVFCGCVSMLRVVFVMLEPPCPPGDGAPIRLCSRPLAKDRSRGATSLLHTKRAWEQYSSYEREQGGRIRFLG